MYLTIKIREEEKEKASILEGILNVKEK